MMIHKTINRLIDLMLFLSRIWHDIVAQIVCFIIFHQIILS